MDPDGDEPRHAELETLEAIYPEIRRAGDNCEPFAFEIDLPVAPATPVTVTFPAAVGNGPLGVSVNPEAAANGPPDGDSLQISHLPPLSLRITLPDGYPSERPPVVKVSTTPPWLSPETLARLEDDGPRLWEEAGRDMVAYTYIDHVQRAADDVFGTINDEGFLEVDAQHKLAVLDYDIKAKRAAFERETFDCGVCLEPKKGTKCHKMLDCGHIFCLQCLQDFYTDAIQEGNLSTVRCLTPNCAKDRALLLSKSAGSERLRKSSVKIFISPSELLQIGLSEDMVKRFVSLKYKTELESDKSTIYCPRPWCNGAARSKKHRKPSGLKFAEISDAESESEVDSDDDQTEVGEKKRTEKEKTKAKRFDPADLLAVCDDCNLAFCQRCLHPWHGEFVRCTPKRKTDELTEEEKLSIEYLQLHTSPCPTCGAPAQKTHGCNHMICSRCDTHFCYLCSAWLDPRNPYRHYNEQAKGKATSCYMRLWELEGGDGDDVGLGFLGGQAARGQREGQDPIGEVEEPFDDGPEPEDRAAPLPQQQQQQLAEEQPPAVALEAPLVLRLNPGRPAVPPAAPAAPPAARGVPLRGGGAPRGRGRGGRARGGRGRGGRGDNGGVAAANQQRARDAGVQDQAGLDAAQEAWVRRFVEMALLDVEDLVDGDSDDDDEGDRWLIR